MKQESFAETNVYFRIFVGRIRELISLGYIIDSQLFIYPEGCSALGNYSIIAHKNQ